MSGGSNEHLKNTLTALMVVPLRENGDFFPDFWEELEPLIAEVVKQNSYYPITPGVRRDLNRGIDKVVGKLMHVYAMEHPGRFFLEKQTQSPGVVNPGIWKEFGEPVSEDDIKRMLADYLRPKVFLRYEEACM